MFRILLLHCFLFLFFSVDGQTVGPDAAYKFKSSGDKLLDRNFYFFTLLQTTAVAKEIEQDTALKRVLQTFRQPTFNGLWSAASINEVSTALIELAKQEPAAFRQLAHEMRRSGVFHLYSASDDTQLIIHAWKNAADALNYIINAYTTGTELRYPSIDSALVSVHSPKYQAEVEVLKSQYSKDNSKFFFQPSEKLALALLKLGKRTEAIKYEPLEETLNKEPLSHVSKTNWSKYTYPAMLVLGASPTGNEPISAMAQSRCSTAAMLYNQQLAPFIIVSGGHVRPPGTQYAEAIEMKRFLVEQLKIPAAAIFVDPYARHTTTNVRNAVRILWRSGFQTDKRMMIVSDPWQLYYVNSPLFAQRCTGELGYLPMKDLQQTKTEFLTFLCDLNSLQQDAHDPLDP
ncbi:YdcF family protein [Chitinophaga silvatica]|uniref:YdcF family protein n=1 Tax=Chitinophaga silvatica TaxID=2282649 RepID=A0A3E1YHG7_9BACT|nr:YdcF family protein [Chitinophaga silvatica]RFS26832.1 YdcF family protein [Chitinophaga silvatica]